MAGNRPAKIAISELAATPLRHAPTDAAPHRASGAGAASSPAVSHAPASLDGEVEGFALRDALRSVYLYWRLGLIAAVLTGVFGIFTWQGQSVSATAETRIIKKNLMMPWFLMTVPDDWSRTLETDVALFQSEAIAETAHKMLRSVAKMNNTQLSRFMRDREPAADPTISPMSETVGVPVDNQAAQRLPWLVVDYAGETVIEPSEALNSSRDVMLLDYQAASTLVGSLIAVRDAGLAGEIQQLCDGPASQMRGLVTVSADTTAGEIIVRCTHSSPELAAFYSNLMPAAFVAANDRDVLNGHRRDMRIFERMLQVAKDDLADAEARYKVALRKIDEQLATVGEHNSMESVGLGYTSLRRHMGQLQTEIRLEETRIQVFATEQETLQREFRAISDPLKREIDMLQKEYNRRLAVETVDSPAMVSLHRRLALLNTQYEERGADNFQPMPSGEQALETQAELRRVQVELERSQQRLKLLREQREDAAAQLVAYPTIAAPIENLSIEVETLRQKVTAITSTLETTRFKAAKIPSYYEWKRSATVANVIFSTQSKYLLIVIIGAVLVGLGMTRVASMLDSRVQTDSQIRSVTRLPVLVNLPILGKQNRFVCRDTPAGRETNGFVYNLFGIMGINIRHLGPKRPEQLLAVVSTMPGEGKSFVSFNLAAYYASQGLRTCLLQTDCRHADLEMFPDLRTEQMAGFIELLAGNGDIHRVEDALYPTDLDNLFVCVPGRITAPPMYLFDSPGFSEFLKDLQELFDAVIVDTAPMLLVADTAVIARQARSVVFVAGLGVVTKTALHTCIDRMKMQHLPIIGTVINRDYMAGYSYYYRYYGNTVAGNAVPTLDGIPNLLAQPEEYAPSDSAVARYFDQHAHEMAPELPLAEADGNGTGNGTRRIGGSTTNLYRFHSLPESSRQVIPSAESSAASSRRQPIVPHFETLAPMPDQTGTGSAPMFDFASPQSFDVAGASPFGADFDVDAGPPPGDGSGNGHSDRHGPRDS